MVNRILIQRRQGHDAVGLGHRGVDGVTHVCVCVVPQVEKNQVFGHGNGRELMRRPD